MKNSLSQEMFFPLGVTAKSQKIAINCSILASLGACLHAKPLSGAREGEVLGRARDKTL